MSQDAKLSIGLGGFLVTAVVAYAFNVGGSIKLGIILRTIVLWVLLIGSWVLCFPAVRRYRKWSPRVRRTAAWFLTVFVLVCLAATLKWPVTGPAVPIPAPAQPTREVAQPAPAPSQQATGPILLFTEGANAISGPVSLAKVEKGPFAEGNVKLVHMYAYLYDNYLGSSNSNGNRHRVIESGARLRKRFATDKPAQFTFVVANLNGIGAIHNVRIQVVFEGKNLTVTRDKDNEWWQPVETHAYRGRAVDIQPGLALGPNGNLWVASSGPVSFTVRCRITADEIGPQDKTFEVELYP